MWSNEEPATLFPTSTVTVCVAVAPGSFGLADTVALLSAITVAAPPITIDATNTRVTMTVTVRLERLPFRAEFLPPIISN
jgi:hypothetical protein